MSAGGAKDDNVCINSVAKVSNPIVIFSINYSLGIDFFFFFFFGQPHFELLAIETFTWAIVNSCIHHFH